MNKILFFGEPLIRITPSFYEKLNDKTNCTLYYGGSEINIARNMSAFGIDTAIFTGLPEHEVGNSFIDFLKQSQIDSNNIQRCGERIGLYYLINGYGVRNSEVYYDRQHTSINDIDIQNIDMNQLFNGITHFHFSGITIAISQHVRDILQVLLEEAKKREIIISIDLNLRTKMISIEDAKKEFSHFAKYADYCFGIDPLMKDENDLTMFDRQHATEKTIEKRMQELQAAYQFKAIFHTIRNVDENMINSYEAYAYDHHLYHSVILKTALLERVGSGDAFVAGLLYQIMNQENLQETIDFAVASGTYKCVVIGDNMYENSQTIYRLLENHSEISR